MSAPWGSVHLVGAGPGAADLLTLRGLARLRAADVVVHDRLVSRDVLDLAPRSAERINVGKVPGDRSAGRFTQTAISALLIARARRGCMVVRLKGGDPFVFGRGAEELDACLEAGVRCEVVPGLSSAIAAPAAAGIALTERGLARSFSVSTARAADGAERPFAVADTQVVLMGIEELPSVVARLLSSGASPETPAAIVASATLQNQRIVFAPLERIATAARGIAPPAVLVVGETVRHAPRRRVFASQPNLDRSTDPTSFQQEASS